MKKIALSLLLLAITGCAPFTDATKTGMGFSNPTDPNQVEILYLAPQGPHEEVGTLITEGWPLSDIAKMHNELRGKAAAMGATAVIMLQPHYTVTDLGTFIGYTAVAIKK